LRNSVLAKRLGIQNAVAVVDVQAAVLEGMREAALEATEARFKGNIVLQLTDCRLIYTDEARSDAR
jgi:hypothetical protein